MKKRISKKLVITTGVFALMLFAPAAPKSTIGQAISTVTNQIEVQAAQTYSDNWKEDDMGNWHFYNDDGTLVKDAWVHDVGEWYLLDSTGTMRTGVFRSNGGKYYILDTVRGTGTYGKLLKDGMVYQGVVLHADTSATYEGALDNETLEQLAAVGVEVVNVPDVENTIHVDKDAERERERYENSWDVLINDKGKEEAVGDTTSGGYYNSQGQWIPPEVAAMNLKESGERVTLDGYLYRYNDLDGEVTGRKIKSKEQADFDTKGLERHAFN